MPPPQYENNEQGIIQGARNEVKYGILWTR